MSYERLSPDLSNDEISITSVDREPTGTIASSYINITNTILGTGMLAMPLAMSNVGLSLGIVMIAAAASASAFGLYLLSQCAHILGTRKSSFFACTNFTIPRAAIAFDAAIAIKCFGVSISYLVVVGDLMPKVVLGTFSDPPTLLTNSGTWITLALFSIAPFAFAKQLNALRHTSLLALVSVAYLLLVVLSFYLFPTDKMPPKPDWSEIEWIKFNSKFFTTLPIFVFAFTCHQNIFSVYNELQDNSPKNVQKVIFYSISTSFLVYLTIAVVGYFTFGRSVTANLIALYPSGPLITGGQFAIALLVLLSYPLQSHPCRNSLDKVIRGSTSGTMNDQQFNLLTSAILFCSWLVAISVSNLATVLALVGATGSTTICYILPGYLYYSIVEKTMAPHSSIIRKMAGFLCIFGILIMIICVSMQLVSFTSIKH